MELDQINVQYEDWQNELSIKEQRLRPLRPQKFHPDMEKLDFMLDCIGIKMKELHRKI